MWRVLIVDDEEIILDVLKKAALEEGCEAWVASTGAQALGIIEQTDVDLVWLDLRLPDIDGLEVFQKIREMDEVPLVIIMTGYASVESAVQAIKAGAYDYIKKPFRADYIKLILKLALDKISLSREVQRLSLTRQGTEGFESIIGTSHKMMEIFALINKIVSAGTPSVLITGESGTGKELVARAIHHMGFRAAMPYIEIDCASIPAHLIESELLGFEKGAFTHASQSKPGLLEKGHRGTIFFDEIGEMELDLQKKMLRILEEKSFRRLGGIRKIQVDFQIVCATNQNLAAMVAKGRFREDLFYRLQVIPVNLPPLREREQDAVLIAKYFIDHFNRDFKKKVRSLSLAAADILVAYDWPGNVRELKNVVERIMITTDTTEILPEHIPAEIISRVMPARSNHADWQLPVMALPDDGIDFKQRVAEITSNVKRQLIGQALVKSRGNRCQAARILGLSRAALWREMQKLKPIRMDA